MHDLKKAMMALRLEVASPIVDDIEKRVRKALADAYDDGKYYGSGKGRISLMEQTGERYVKKQYDQQLTDDE